MSHTTIYRALLVTLGLLLLNIANQATRQGKAVQTVDRGFGPITVPVDPLPCSDDDLLKLAAVRNPSIQCSGGGK